MWTSLPAKFTIENWCMFSFILDLFLFCCIFMFLLYFVRFLCFSCAVYICMFLSKGVVNGVWYFNNVFVSHMCELVGGSVTDTVLITWLNSLQLLMFVCVEFGVCCV